MSNFWCCSAVTGLPLAHAPIPGLLMLLDLQYSPAAHAPQ
jgi:hypothetical protein